MLYKELPTVVPFYLSTKNQNRFKENVSETCEAQSLISPNNYHLPFMIDVHCKKRPNKWIIRDTSGREFLDVSSNVDRLKGVKYDDGKVYAFFNGGSLEYTNGGRTMEVVLEGAFYHEITFGSITYISEIIYYKPEAKFIFDKKYMRIEFSSDPDISELRYFEDFKQVIYLDTFDHSSRVVYDEEGHEDGIGNFFPELQKLDFFYQNVVLTRDFMKNALYTLQLHNDITISYKDERYSEENKILISSEEVENGAFHSVVIDVVSRSLYKGGCEGHNIEDSDFFLT